MPAFAFSGQLPQFKGLITSSQLTNRFNDIKTFLDTVNALGLTLPTSVASASQFQALVLNAGKTGFDFAHVLRTAGAFNVTGTPTSGQLIQATSGTAGIWATIPIPANIGTIKTGNYTAVDGDFILANTTSGTFTITLPATPSAGNRVYIVDYAGTFNSNKLTIGRNGSNINNLAENCDCFVRYARYTCLYQDSTTGWLLIQGLV